MGDGKGSVFNLGTGTGFSVQEILDSIARVTGQPVPCSEGMRRQGDPPVLVADGSAVQRALGWKPQHSSLDCIIDTAWQWLRSPKRQRIGMQQVGY